MVCEFSPYKFLQMSALVRILILNALETYHMCSPPILFEPFETWTRFDAYKLTNTSLLVL